MGISFDIDDNVGLYSIYYGLNNKGPVYAFETPVFDLSILAKNVYENSLQDRIKIITNPLSEKNKFANFTLSSIEEGGARSVFGVVKGMMERKSRI